MATGVSGPTRARIEAEDASRGPLVGLPAHHVRGVHGVRHLRDMAGLQRQDYYAEPYLFADLLAVPRRLRARLLRLRAAVRVVAAVVGADHPDLPARLPDDLLLLPQGLLPGVLAVTSRCAVASRTRSTRGETRLPLILNNIHRYFWYAAVLVALILSYDVVLRVP